ncbi:hypothetical protein ACP4OV_016157 [Aristida adscensionis]
MATASSGTLCKHHGASAVASRRRLRACAAACLAALLLVAAAAAALALVALRPGAAAAAATLEALRLTSLSFSPTGRPSLLSATFDADLAVRNRNPVAAFAHAAGRAEVYYRGALAADAEVPAGRVAEGGAEAVTVRLTVLADRLAERAAQLYADVVAGAGDVPLTVRTEVPGEATVLGVLRRRVVVTTVCDVVVSARAPGAQTSSCRYRTKL